MTLSYKLDHIPRDTPKNRRPGLAMTATTITIHNTGNSSSTAANERAWLTNTGNPVTASYHIVIDQRGAIECLPLDEVGWHAGDGNNGPGNRSSIGIELCESGDYERTLGNAAALVAQMLVDRGWGVERLRRHFDWSGKVCPRLMYVNGSWSGWEKFKEAVSLEIDKLKTPADDDITGHWAEADIRKVITKGLMSGYPDGSFKPDRAVTRAELASVLARLADKGL